MTHKVLDTNIILSDANNITTLGKGDTVIVIPETVIHELDSKKSGFDEINFQAREFARFMTSLVQVGQPTKTINDLTITTLANNEITVRIVSNNVYDMIDAATPIKIINDQRIIEVATKYKACCPEGTELIFLSLDLMCRLTASAKGLEVAIPLSKAPKNLELFKQAPLESIYFNAMDSKSITSFVPDHTPDTFSYEFQSQDGNSERGIVVRDTIQLLKEDEFNKLIVKPINQKQKLWCKALLTDAYDLNVLEAKAGTGKNLTSLSCAMRLIDENPKYDKIIYIRNSIESIDKGADVGYLAGNDEKFRIYNMPLYDTIDYIAKASFKKGSASTEMISERSSDLMTKYAIETMWVGEARGRTLSNAIVILDEWQNSSDNTTQLILSRLDDTCKAIVIGSNRQIDNPYLNKYNNGLTSLMNDLPKANGLTKFSITLDKAVRGKYAEYAETLFDKGV